MKRYLVRSGNIEHIVEVEDTESAEDAMAKLFTLFDENYSCGDDECPPAPGEVISAIEVVGQELWWDSKSAIKLARTLGRGDIDASLNEWADQATDVQKGANAWNK